MMRQGWDYQQWNEFGSHKAAGLYIYTLVKAGK
jgi:hypothetical protein